MLFATRDVGEAVLNPQALDHKLDPLMKELRWYHDQASRNALSLWPPSFVHMALQF